MTKKVKEKQTTVNEPVKDEKTFTQGDAYPNCEGEPCDNVAEDDAPEADKTAQLQAQVADWKEKYLRLSAEFDNYRKRTLKEKMDLISSGGEGVLKALLPVADDFDRALQAMASTSDIESVKSGIVLISQKLNDMLKANGVEEIESIGKELDTDLHEAVAKFPSEDNKGKIIDVVQKGYKKGDKVIRYAKVVVGE